MIKEKLSALCKSPLRIATNMMRRNLLRLKGVSFGSGLTLEGHVDIGAARSICIGSRVRLGKHIYLGTSPDSELRIGDNTYIGRNCIILAHQSVIIGSDCLIAPGCHITDVNHGIAAGELIRKRPLQRAAVLMPCMMLIEHMLFEMTGEFFWNVQYGTLFGAFMGLLCGTSTQSTEEQHSLNYQGYELDEPEGTEEMSFQESI